VDPRGVKNQRRNLYKKKAKTTPQLEETSQAAPDLSMRGMHNIAETEAL
jgi:hypothetical protein